MRLLVIIGLVTASGCLAQEQTPKPEEPSAEVQQQSPAASEKQVITVPGGTRIPLVLTSPVGTKSSQPGDPVRAETAFPVTVDDRVAVPLGTYVAGEIAAVTRPSSSRRAGLQMHFTRLIFANGYEVALFEATAEARVRNPEASSPVASSLGIQSTTVDVQSFEHTPVLYTVPGELQQPPAPPPLPKLGPSRGVIAGLVAGVVATVVAFVYLARHQGRSDTFLGTGSKIDLILARPLTLDADSVAAAAASSNR
jgi:hypothetical protein